MSATKKDALSVSDYKPEHLAWIISTKRIPLTGARSFGTHHFPHIDEMTGFAFFEVYGKELFPDIKEGMPIHFYDDAKIKRLGGWAQILRDQGDILIGVGHSPWDEHQNGEGRKSLSSARLVAEHLGVQNRPEVKSVLDYIDAEDSGGDAKFIPGNANAKNFLLGSQVKNTWEAFRKKKATNEEVVAQIRVFVNMIKNMLSSQRDQHEGGEEILEKVRFVNLELMTPKDWCPEPKIAIYKGDEEKVQHHLFKTGDQNILGVICLRSDGQFQVMSIGKRLRHPQLSEIAKALRAEILRWKNRELPPHKHTKALWQDLMMSGEHPSIPGLYYDKQESGSGHIFNGSLTRPETKGLVGESLDTHPLTPKLVIDIVRTALEDKWWTRDECVDGICPAADKSREYFCPIWHLGLERCRGNRRNMCEGDAS